VRTVLTLACVRCGAPIRRRLAVHNQNLRRKRPGPFCSKRCSALTVRRGPQPQPVTSETFWPRVDQSGDCWPWLGARQSTGYGNLKADGRYLRAHRVAYELANGPIPDGMEVMHLCDNPPCCNPAHLAIGDHAANMAQQWDKRGRKTPAAMQRAAERMDEVMG
jgi:hypothetical protein